MSTRNDDLTFSVVVPTFNRRGPVMRALQSVMAQTHRPLEVIVVDDASTDGTVEALRSSTFPVPVDVLALPVNRGPAAARNAGIARASARYVAFLDSDDEWLPQKLEIQASLLRRCRRPDNTLVYSPAWMRRRHETFVTPARAKHPGEPVADYVFANGGYFDQNTIVLPARLARQVRYDEALRLHEDWDFYLRLEALGVDFIMAADPLSITTDLAAHGRASRAQPELSLSLLERWKPAISERAYLGLRARIAPQLREHDALRALRYIAHAYARGAIGHWMALVLAGRLVHPELRTFAYWIRGRLSRTGDPLVGGPAQGGTARR